DVHVLLDLSESKAVSSEAPLIDKLRAAGIDVVIGTSPHKHAIMHNKFSIADGEWVEDGSWNITSNADDQANTLNMNIVPSPQRASLFRATWDKLHDFMKAQQDKRDSTAQSVPPSGTRRSRR
ncbi:MAG: phospholipase D-like domain-containing protein, partial [Terriglobales bacterium]